MNHQHQEPGRRRSAQVFEYFSSIKREDGSTSMKPSDLLAALVAVYPPDAGPAGPVRSGSLPGERAPRPAKDRHQPVWTPPRP